MRATPLTNPTLLVFVALLAGILAADQGTAAEILLSVPLVVGLASVIARAGMSVCGGRFSPGPFTGLPLVVRIIFLLYGVFCVGVALMTLPAAGDAAFAGDSGAEVTALVEVRRTLRRDDVEVSAVATVLRAANGGSGDEAGRRLILRCGSPDGLDDVSCRDVVNGAVLAVRGRVLRGQRGETFLFAGGGSTIMRVSPQSGRSGVDSIIDGIRADLTYRAGTRLDGASRWMVPAIVLGEGRGVPFVDRNALSVLGTAHVISVSGLHVVAAAGAFGFAALLLLGIPASLFFQRLNVTAIAAVVSVFSAWLVSFMAGSPPPAVRAAGMATAYVLTRFLRRRVPAESVLAAVGICNLVVKPEDALSISFQLSYMAVFGLIVGAGLFSGHSEKQRGRTDPIGIIARLSARFVKGLKSGLVVSIGASLATMPLTILCFNSAPVVGPLSNLVVVPCFSVWVFPGAILVLVLLAINPGLTPWTGLSGVIAGVYSAGVDFIMSAQRAMARPVPGILVNPPYPLNMLLAILTAAAMALLMPGPRRARFALAASVSLMLLMSSAWRAPPAADVVFLDAGKGDASVIRCPSGEVWLVDATAPGRATDRLLYGLARAGFKDIDGVILTHAHDDHYGGISTLVEVFGKFELAGSPRTLDLVEPLASEILDHGGTVRRIRAGESAIPDCGVETTVLKSAPPAPPVGQRTREYLAGENDSSLVFRLGPVGSGVLFAGDLESAGESELLSSGVPLSAAVLKAGHHGSRGASSPGFLRAVKPVLVIVTGWPNGPRKGPDDTLLSRFVELKSRVVSTVVSGDTFLDIGCHGHGRSAFPPVMTWQARIPDGFYVGNGLATTVMNPVRTP